MKSSIACLTFSLCVVTVSLAGEPAFKPVADSWLHPPSGETIGQCHGDVAVSSAGEIYVSVEQGTNPGVQVYSPEGKYLRNVPNAPSFFHGFVIHKEAAGEFIYGADLFTQTVYKMQLDGKILLKFDAGPLVPDELKIKFQDRPRLLLTGVDVAPDGRLFVVDGYASDYIHIFSPEGAYLKSIGGKAEPFNFKTNHKIAIDTRFDPARIICCDRENRRMIHMSLEGELLGFTPEMKRPGAVTIHGDYAVVAEIEGRVSFLDKEGNAVATLGENEIAEQTATNEVKPQDWRPGKLTAPHGLDFSPKGDLFLSEFNKYGRVVRFNHVEK